jgi:hypothetical protein
MTSKHDDMALFRTAVRDRAAARGWPQITYEAVHHQGAGETAAGERSRIVTSGLITSDDPRASLAVTVGQGEAPWTSFLDQAIYYDVAAANTALLKLS